MEFLGTSSFNWLMLLGSNMVPVDAFEHRVDRSWYRRLVESSIASNYNMLRLWSSGNYYSDDLYDVADECKTLCRHEMAVADQIQNGYSPVAGFPIQR